jgi:O-succinylbenzoate synthase
VGIPDGGDLGRLIGEVAAARERAARVRLKVGPGWDAAPVEAVRTAFPDLALQVDANGAYRLEAAGGPDAFGRLADLDRFGLACIEQPLAAADLAALAEAARRLTTPVGLDESLSTPRRLADALRYGACEVAVLKPGRLGGLLAARRCAQRCADAGVPAFVGGFFDTGLARAANAALAALPGFTLPGDLSDPAAYLAEDPVAGPVPQAGRVALYAGPGVAPLPDPALVAARTVLRARLGP